VSDFVIDWNGDRQAAICPAGHESSSWTEDLNHGRRVARIRFSAMDCRVCPLESRCTRSAGS
jgi:hypothetical protein